jgi:hypothetical protein
MSACVYSVFVLSCVGSSHAKGWSPVQGVLPTVSVILVHSFRLILNGNRPEGLIRKEEEEFTQWCIARCH